LLYDIGHLFHLVEGNSIFNKLGWFLWVVGSDHAVGVGSGVGRGRFIVGTLLIVRVLWIVIIVLLVVTFLKFPLSRLIGKVGTIVVI
jgi:hypothetical protein